MKNRLMAAYGEESPLTRFASRVRFPAHISHPAGNVRFHAPG
jgi:hypothetical protein